MFGIEQKKKLSHYLGGIYIPASILSSKAPLLLHISNTPRSSYKAINHLIGRLHPEIIIHTGNLVADIRSWDLDSIASPYEIALRQIMAILNGSKAKTCYISLGEKDNEQSVHEVAYPKMDVVSPFGEFQIQGKTIGFSYGKIISEEKTWDYHFFGAEEGSDFIHVMDLGTGEVFDLLYPIGAKSGRTKKMKRW